MDDELKVTRIRPENSAGDALNRAQELLKRYGGGKGGGGSGGGNNGSGAKGGGAPSADWTGKLALGIMVLLVVLWGGCSSYYTVDLSEEAVVTRFGAYDRTTPPGMHLKLPFGIEEVTVVQSKKVLQEEFGFRTRGNAGDQTSYDKEEYVHESLMLTGDLNVADVEWILQFRITDPWKYLFHARDVRHNIRDLSLAIMRRVVGDRLVGDVLTTGRVAIAEQAKALTQEVLTQYDLGVTVDKIILQGVNPPEKVKPAFNEVNAAKQEQEQTINEAEREYNKVIPEARGKAEQEIADAEGYAIDIVNRAKGNAAQFDGVAAEYKKSPEITRRRLYLEAMETVFAQVDQVTIVDNQLKGLMPIFSQGGGK